MPNGDTKGVAHHVKNTPDFMNESDYIDRSLYTYVTYMTSYLAQAYRLWILIDKSTLFIDSWLIRLYSYW